MSMQEPSDLPERPSKTKRKKQMLALQKIGEILVNLPASQLAKIPLEPTLSEAIHAARIVKSREGKRRQLQYIGRLMRHIDSAPIEAALDKIQMKSQVSKAQFHSVERWRDQLIDGGNEVLQTFIQKFPNTDTQQLRQLVRNAQKDKEIEKNTGAETALFRYLREVIDQPI